jgi:rare lipoprotein A
MPFIRHFPAFLHRLSAAIIHPFPLSSRYFHLSPPIVSIKPVYGNMKLINEQQQDGIKAMKSNDIISLTSKVSGIALMLFQIMSNTAAADYRGYWMDTVQQYQGQGRASRGNAYWDQARPYQQRREYREYRDTQYRPAPAYNNKPAPAYRDNYAPMQANRPLATGRASYYASQYQGRRTASGETYNMYDMTAAHPNLPFGTPIRVTNLENGRSVVVRVNDRGPFKPGRVVDVSLAAAQQLGLILNGSANVQVDVLG